MQKFLYKFVPISVELMPDPSHGDQHTSASNWGKNLFCSAEQKLINFWRLGNMVHSYFLEAKRVIFVKKLYTGFKKSTF